MKKVLLATSALVAAAGFASAQGVSVTGTASMGILGGGWINNMNTAQGIGRADCGTNVHGETLSECPIPGQTEYEFHTDIDVAFAMSGQTDAGLTFGASIDLDESDGDEGRGNSHAFGGRTQGGEEIFVSGAFGTLTMGDTDGALDWALQEIGIGSSLGDAHTTHAGYSGNNFADGFGGQIARYDYSFGDFAVALSANLSDDASHEDILAVGAKYNASLAAMELGIGVGYSQLGHDGEENDALGISLDANFNNGFRAILNWVDMGDSPHASDNIHFRLPLGQQPAVEGGEPEHDSEQYIGIGIGYTLDDWTFAFNYGQYTEDQPGTANDPGQSGYAFAVNYDLGGGAEVQLGYSNSTCEKEVAEEGPPTPTLRAGGSVFHNACSSNNDNSTLSLGVTMNF